MNRPAKALIFIVVATLANLLATALIFVALLGLYGLTLGRFLKIASAAPVIFIAFALAVVLAALIYRKALKILRTRYNLEQLLGMK